MEASVDEFEDHSASEATMAFDRVSDELEEDSLDALAQMVGPEHAQRATPSPPSLNPPPFPQRKP
jgi:hypothetical protein